MKCTACVCYKMRDKRFLMKLIPKDVVELQEFIDMYENQEGVKVDPRNSQNRQSRKLTESVDIQFMDPWINLPP